MHYSLSFSRIEHIAGLPNLFTGTGHNCERKVIAGHMHFYQEFLPRNSDLFFAALMAKTNVRPFYLPENVKPFHEEINRAKGPRWLHKIASRAKCGRWWCRNGVGWWWCRNANVASNKKVENLGTTILCIHFKRLKSLSFGEPCLGKRFFIFVHLENFMYPAWVVKKFEFWRARLGQTLIVAPPIFVTFSLFLLSTHF